MSQQVNSLTRAPIEGEIIGFRGEWLDALSRDDPHQHFSWYQYRGKQLVVVAVNASSLGNPTITFRDQANNEAECHKIILMSDGTVAGPTSSTVNMPVFNLILNDSSRSSDTCSCVIPQPKPIFIGPMVGMCQICTSCKKEYILR